MNSPEILFEMTSIRLCEGYDEEGHKYCALFYKTTDNFGATYWYESDMVKGSVLHLIKAILSK